MVRANPFRRHKRSALLAPSRNNCAMYIMIVIVAFIQTLIVQKGEMDWASFISSKALLLVVREVFPKTDFSDVNSTRAFIDSSNNAILCSRFKVRCDEPSSPKVKQVHHLLELITPHHIARNDGSHLDVRLYYPYDHTFEDASHLHTEKKGVIVWFHGGGWVLGSLDADDLRCSLLAKYSNLVVVSVDYRLAPEHVFPAPVMDAVEAIKWVVKSREATRRFQLDKNKVIVGGESSGGNLAAAAVAYLVDHGHARLVRNNIKGMLLIYPPMDMNFNSKSYLEHSRANGILTSKQMKWFWSLYLRGHNASVDEETSRFPISTHPYSNNGVNACKEHGYMLCPNHIPTKLLQSFTFETVLVQAKYDVLYDDGVSYANKLAKAGNGPVYLCSFNSTIHGFMFNYQLPNGISAVARVGKRLFQVAYAKELKKLKRGGHGGSETNRLFKISGGEYIQQPPSNSGNQVGRWDGTIVGVGNALFEGKRAYECRDFSNLNNIY